MQDIFQIRKNLIPIDLMMKHCETDTNTHFWLLVKDLAFVFGMRFALVQINVALAYLILNFRIQLSPKQKPICFRSKLIVIFSKGWHYSSVRNTIKLAINSIFKLSSVLCTSHFDNIIGISTFKCEHFTSVFCLAQSVFEWLTSFECLTQLK